MEAESALEHVSPILSCSGDSLGVADIHNGSGSDSRPGAVDINNVSHSIRIFNFYYSIRQIGRNMVFDGEIGHLLRIIK